jgi:hypothetical protein
MGARGVKTQGGVDGPGKHAFLDQAEVVFKQLERFEGKRIVFAERERIEEQGVERTEQVRQFERKELGRKELEQQVGELPQQAGHELAQQAEGLEQLE